MTNTPYLENHLVSVVLFLRDDNAGISDGCSYAPQAQDFHSACAARPFLVLPAGVHVSGRRPVVPFS